MVKIGERNQLQVTRIDAKGYYLDGGENEGEIFLPKTDVHDVEVEIGTTIDVFLYRNVKRNAIATTHEPSVYPGKFGFMTAESVSTYGALLDWGISAPLFMPSREWRTAVRAGREYLVYVYYDSVTEQIIATMHTERYLDQDVPHYAMNSEVDLLVTDETELGWRVIVDNAYRGLIYNSEIFEYVERGMRTRGYVKYVRADGKIDVALQKQGLSVVNNLDDMILKELQRCGGYIALSDKSDPDVIADRFGCSKKVFKKTIGVLYKHRHILIEPEGIRLVSMKESGEAQNKESKENKEEQ